jgi:uncharacterized short protein YbdD (DUF466 family)
MLLKLKHFWRNIRQLSGEDAYELYLARFAEHQKLHAHKIEQLPLSRKDFFKQTQDSKWTGIKRCC